MNTQNFEAFNRIALFALVRLFEAFPEPVDLDARGIGIEAKPEEEDETYEEVWQNGDLGYWTIAWLRDEGFMKVGSTTMDSEFQNVRLTLKGLTLLGYAAPSVGEPEEDITFAERAKTVLAEGGRSAAIQVVKDLFISAARLGLSALV